MKSRREKLERLGEKLSEKYDTLDMEFNRRHFTNGFAAALDLLMPVVDAGWTGAYDEDPAAQLKAAFDNLDKRLSETEGEG